MGLFVASVTEQGLCDTQHNIFEFIAVEHTHYLGYGFH